MTEGLLAAILTITLYRCGCDDDEGLSLASHLMVLVLPSPEACFHDSLMTWVGANDGGGAAILGLCCVQGQADGCE